MSEAEKQAMEHFHAYQSEMYRVHGRNRCWWGHRTRDQAAEWERRLAAWFEAAGEIMP